jgi:hypothetical protein
VANLDITCPRTGRSRLLAARCTTCILRPGDLMHLGAERVREFVQEALDRDTYVVCHQTLPHLDGEPNDFRPAICRGFFDAYADRVTPLRILRIVDRLIEVEPPQEDLDALVATA